MIKFNGGYKGEHESYVIGFGLSDDNLRLLPQDRPIHVRSEELRLPNPGADFIMVYAKDEEEIRKIVSALSEKVGYEDDQQIAIGHIMESFYVATLSMHQSDRILYVIVFDDTSMSHLRDEKILEFRVRYPDSKSLPISFILYCGKTEENMYNKFREFGLI